MARVRFTSFLFLLLLPACTVTQTVEGLEDRNPPPEFGRPGWVRFIARTCAWVGGAAGGVLSVALLPVTWPISLLCDEGLGEYSTQEFLFLPAVGGASLGHFLLGTPPDVLDHVFRRAWQGGEVPPSSYELVPMELPQGPRREEPPEAPR